MPKHKVKATPWLPEMYKAVKTTVFQRVLIYMALNPGEYFTIYRLSKTVSDRWPTIEADLHRLVAAGLVQLTVGYLMKGKRRYEAALGPVLSGGVTPEHLYELPDNRPVLVYSASPDLVKRVESGAFLKLIERRPRQEIVSVNERVIQILAARHAKTTEGITVSNLKKQAEISESHPNLAKRLEHLAELDWVVIDNRLSVPTWQGADTYWLAYRWVVKLSAGGWLRIQRAEKDGVAPTVPKPRKAAKPKKLEVSANV